MSKTLKLGRIPVLLLLFGSIAVLFGSYRIVLMVQGLTADTLPDDPEFLHYFTTPVPILLHVITGIIFTILGPFQFAPNVRKNWPRFHRASGRVFVISGLCAAVTALWMNQFFPAFGGWLKYSANVVFSIGLCLTLLLAVHNILHKKVLQHRAWMMRAFAIGLGAATQRLVLLPLFMLFGMSEIGLGLGIWFGWLINLTVVEVILYRENRLRQLAR